MNLKADTTISFEQYAEWARSRYPGYHAENELSHTEEAVYASAETEPPASSDACPVTVKSNQNGYVVVTPRIQRSR